MELEFSFNGDTFMSSVQYFVIVVLEYKKYSKSNSLLGPDHCNAIMLVVFVSLFGILR